MRYALTGAAIVAALAFFSSPASPQINSDHAKAWDRYEGKPAARSRRATVKRPLKARRIAYRPQRLKTPFGTTTQTRVSRAGMPAEIATFLDRVRAECGSVTVTSTFRPGSRVAGSGRLSCHATGQAVDYQTSNPSCALKLAAGSSLGHSVDYRAVNHFHISTCAQERGARFAHYTGRRTRVAMAHRAYGNPRYRVRR